MRDKKLPDKTNLTLVVSLIQTIMKLFPEIL